jgi:putative colanic acid biosynthesis UDP-glucose lipid carrier transferase
MDESGNSHAIGKFMRKYSLDELPQFINVFKGQMSVVGPRPHMLEHTSDYRKALDSFMLRHLIQPGLSGLAQVQGHRGSIEHDEDLKARVAADVYYMENWSLLLDLKIVGLTFIQLFSPSPRAR